MFYIICPKTGLTCQNTGCAGRCMQQDVWQPIANPGWQCPKCGRGNAPWMSSCPCGPAYTVTFGNDTKLPGDANS